MKHQICACLWLALSLLAVPAFADVAGGSSVSPGGKGIGIGIEVGAPTSIDIKLMVGNSEGIVIGVGGGIWYDESLALHLDYLWHPLVAHFDGGTLSGYIGVGGWASVGVDGAHIGYYQPFYRGAQPVALGLRVPFGISLAFNTVPIELFAELVPAVEVFPGIGVFGQGGLGARFYF